MLHSFVWVLHVRFRAHVQRMPSRHMQRRLQQSNKDLGNREALHTRPGNKRNEEDNAKMALEMIAPIPECNTVSFLEMSANSQCKRTHWKNSDVCVWETGILTFKAFGELNSAAEFYGYQTLFLPNPSRRREANHACYVLEECSTSSEKAAMI
eukprot:144835-Amphidinium_carterae.1